MNVDLINIVALAYLGDAVYELYIRKYLIYKGIAKVNELQKEAVNYVSAKSQNKILNYLINNNVLTDDEMTVIKRGRNYKRDSHPKNTDIITYKMSTGLEALFGYLYMKEDINRIEGIVNYILEGENEKNT